MGANPEIPKGMKTALEMADLGALVEELRTQATQEGFTEDDRTYLNWALDLAGKEIERARKVEAGQLVPCRFAAVIEGGEPLWFAIRGGTGPTLDDWMSEILERADGTRSFGTVYLEPPTVHEVEAEVDDDGKGGS